jgi:hypothetical protein
LDLTPTYRIQPMVLRPVPVMACEMKSDGC